MATLKERLNQMNGTGAAAPRPSLMEQIRRSRPRPSAAALAARVGGEAEGEGLVRLDDRRPLSGTHGRFPLEKLKQGFAHPDTGRPLDPQKLVFLDLETTGLAGGTGTTAFLAGLLRLDGAALHLQQFMMVGFGGEGALLEAVANAVEGMDAVVTFNGKTFDAPLLNTRYRMNGRGDPLGRMEHIDLLHPVRRAFSDRWVDCRLQTAERRLLGYRRVGDLPGSEAPEAWLDWVRWGEAGRLPDVMAHNRWDLISLTALLAELAGVRQRPSAAGADPVAVARGCLRRGDPDHALHLLSAAREELDPQGLLLLASLYRRRGEWEAACPIWEKLAGQGRWEAAEALAKYHEHQRQDPDRALEWAGRLPAGPDHEHRRARLQEKAAGLIPTSP